MTGRALYVMIGGFLGAGKTTAIGGIARLLSARGLRVGLITNDQSYGLVDTQILRGGAHPVEEITGGCFCCRFDSLIEASRRLTAQSRPDVFLAEPVGSCTDLVATVSFPLRRLYGEDYRVAPLSVVVDPLRAERVLGLDRGGNFSPKVLYVYRKQLEEAELIVINKCDLLAPARQDRLEAALRAAFPNAALLRVSARTGTGMDVWTERLMRAAGATAVPEVDYDIYAEGEALLGWLNVSALVRFDGDADGNAFLQSLAAAIRAALSGCQIAHLKMTLAPGDQFGDVGVVNLVRSDAPPELSHALEASLSAGELLVNLRAEADPATLKSAVLAALDGSGCRVEIRNADHFRPARPQPTHRTARL